MLRATWRGLETWHGLAACRRASPRPYLWEPGAGDRLRRPGGRGEILVPTATMGLPRQRLTRISGYRIGGDQSGGTGTILQTCHELASFQLVELHLIPASQGCSAAWPHAAVRHPRAQSPQYLGKQTSGGTIDEALACQERKCFVSSGEGVSYPCIFFSRI